MNKLPAFVVAALSGFICALYVMKKASTSPVLNPIATELVPPHEVRDDAKLALLIDAYKSGLPVTPVVVLDYGDEMRALSGSHRIEAMREVFSEIPDEYLIVVDSNEVIAAIEATPEKDWSYNTNQALDYAERKQVWGDFNVIVELLLPYLPANAQAALADQF